MQCLRTCVGLVLLLSVAFAKIAQQNAHGGQQVYQSDPFANVEIIHENIVERFLGSLGGIIVGMLAIFLGAALLFWNEGRTLHTRRALSEAQRVCVEASPDAPLSANEGKLVHMNGNASAKEEYLGDPLFYVAANGVIKLRRVVEMYQWTERSTRNTQKHVGGGQTTVKNYNYQTEWSQNLVDSAHFYNSRDHVNPKDMRGFTSEEFVTSEVRVGAFTVPRAMVSSFNNYQTLPLDMNRLNAINPTCRPTHTLGEYVYYASGEPLHPLVGDVRVSWQYVAGGPVSIVARQAGASFAPFEYAGATVQLLQTGNLTAAEQFSSATRSNKVFTWVLRILGFIVIWIGFAISFEPIGVVFDVIPFLGDVARLGTGLFALSSSLVLTLIVVSVAWLFYRPLKALAILAVAAALLYVSSQQGRAVATGSRR